MMSKSKFSSLLKGKSVPNLPSYSTPWGKNDDKLWNAVKQQNLKQVKSLLSKASVTATKLGPQGKSVFHLACEIGNEQIVDAILACTQDVNDTTIQGVTALQRAAAKGHTSTVIKLLKKQANVDQRDCDGMSALHHACFGQHQDCVKVLLSKNADPNAMEQGGKTPLFYSAHLGHVDICRWLLDKGADANCQDKDNVTPLILAAKEGHKNVCELLLRRGANPELVDRNGKRAMDHAVKHLEVQELLTRSLLRATDRNSDGESVSLESSKSQLNSVIETITSPAHSKSSVYRGATAVSDENISRADVHSIHSMDDSLLYNRPPSPIIHRPYIASRSEQAYKELKEERDQLNEVYSSLSIENLKLRDTVESLQKKLLDRQDRENLEVKNLQEQLEKLRKKFEPYESLQQSHVTESGSSSIITEKKAFMALRPESGGDDITDQEKLDKKGYNENQLIAILKSQVHALRSENEQLKHSVRIPNGDLESPSDETNQKLGNVVLSEREQLEKQNAQLREHLEKHQQRGAIDQEELLHQNKTLTANIESLMQMVVSLQEELEAAKREPPTEAQRLDIILAASRNFEEVNFDEEGFVEGRDMTKEEFLQAQNQQLKTQCSLLAEELEKLRVTFDAILKAGDNLQADYDHLATEKDALQDELELTLKEKRELVAENEFILTDNNELHENLKKVIHELEKIQEKFQTVQAENEELKRSVTVASKVGEVARLLEDRDVLQQKYIDLEMITQRLQHDHSILLEEVQSLNDSVNQITSQRNQLAADLEELEPICQQHEALQQEYSQLEIEFAELLRDKETLEQQVSNNNKVSKEADAVKVPGITSMENKLKQLIEEKQTLEEEKQMLEEEKQTLEEEKQMLEEEKQQLQDVVKALSKHNVDVENKVTELEKSLGEIAPTSVESERRELADIISSKDNEIRTHQEEIMSLKEQISELNCEVEEWEKKHDETVTTYRTHLLSAVQGHMDPDVKDALYHIIELRSMEQFC